MDDFEIGIIRTHFFRLNSANNQLEAFIDEYKENLGDEIARNLEVILESLKALGRKSQEELYNAGRYRPLWE